MTSPAHLATAGLPHAAPVADTPSNNFSVGLLAFAAFVFLVVSLWLLMRNMNARIRRMSYAERDRLEQPSPGQVPRRSPEVSPPGATGSDEQGPAEQA